jgi:hypothetical protein
MNGREMNSWLKKLLSNKSEVGKVNSKSNGDEALSDESP